MGYSFLHPIKVVSFLNIAKTVIWLIFGKTKTSRVKIAPDFLKHFSGAFTMYSSSILQVSKFLCVIRIPRRDKLITSWQYYNGRFCQNYLGQTADVEMMIPRCHS